MADSTQKIIREMRKRGWIGRITRGDHLVFTHPDTDHVIRTGASPSDVRVQRKLRSEMRRALSRPGQEAG
jgi:predicted RNA binding protein YcfA (HicA-like mRNA interferase family)